MIYFGSNRKLVKVGAPIGYLVYVLALTGKKKKNDLKINLSERKINISSLLQKF